MRGRNRGEATRLVAAAGAAATTYMVFEAQWLELREEKLSLPQLPDHLEGLRILHLSDVHAGQPGLNLWTLGKAVRWAARLSPDLVFLTGDILGGKGRGSRRCLRLLSRLRPRLGMYAVTGNHEYGLSKNPFAHTPQRLEWDAAGVTLLSDTCIRVEVSPSDPGRGGDMLICGSDYLTGGHGLGSQIHDVGVYPVLLVHRPPEPSDKAAHRFPLIFAGHTHGGQIRFPTPWGRRAIHRDGLPYTEGVHRQNGSTLVLSRGVGTTFLPLRLLTRPEVVIYRLESVDRERTGDGVSGIYE